MLILVQTNAGVPPPVVHGNGSCYVSWNDNLIVFGGEDAPNEVHQFDFSRGSWTRLSPMPESHSYFGCVLLPSDKKQVLVVSNQVFDLLNVILFSEILHFSFFVFLLD